MFHSAAWDCSGGEIFHLDIRAQSLQLIFPCFCVAQSPDFQDKMISGINKQIIWTSCGIWNLAGEIMFPELY